MDPETLAALLAASDPAGPTPPGFDPAIDRPLWDWGGGVTAALTLDGRIRLSDGVSDRALPVGAWLALLAQAIGG